MPKTKNPTHELIEQCGADAQTHPVVLVGTVLRFKANPAVRAMTNGASPLVDLNRLAILLDPLMDQPEVRLWLRKFYRDMGYSLCGYLDIFGEQLDEEEAGSPESGIDEATRRAGGLR